MLQSAAAAQITSSAGVVASGGGLATDGGFTSHGVVAQLAAGPATDGTYDHRGGFLRVLAMATDVFPGTDPLPRSFALKQNFPNPFNPSTAIDYELASSAWVRISVFNMLGQSVNVLVDQLQLPGKHRVLWPGTDRGGHPVASGLYVYRIEAGAKTATRKMLLLR